MMKWLGECSIEEKSWMAEVESIDLIRGKIFRGQWLNQLGPIEYNVG